MSILASLMRNRRWLRHRRCRKREMFLSVRSEEHTSELQSQSNLVCRLLLEKKKKITDHQQGTNLSIRRAAVRKDLEGPDDHAKRESVSTPLCRGTNATRASAKTSCTHVTCN